MEESVIVQKIQAAVFPLYAAGEPIGTAWLFDSSKHLLTFGHGFEGLLKDDILLELELHDIKSRSVCKVVHYDFDYDSGLDFAVLECQGLPDSTCPLPISFRKDPSGKFVTLGYGSTLSDLAPAIGEIVGQYRIKNFAANTVFKLRSPDTGESGYSGSPIFSIEENAVVAIQTEATRNLTGANRDTVIACPLFRIAESYPAIRNNRTKLNMGEFIEKQVLRTFAFSLLGLGPTDNLNAYVRCILVKYTADGKYRFTFFEIDEGQRDNERLRIRVRKVHKRRKKDYGVVGIMNRHKVPVFYDFINNRCYVLSLGNQAEEIKVGRSAKGAREKRAALLVAPLTLRNEIIGALSFDFFMTNRKRNRVIRKIQDEDEISRLLYMSEEFAKIVSSLLTADFFTDRDFLND